MLGQVTDESEWFGAVHNGEHQVTLTARESFGTALGGGFDSGVGAVNACRKEKGQGGVQ